MGRMAKTAGGENTKNSSSAIAQKPVLPKPRSQTAILRDLDCLNNPGIGGQNPGRHAPNSALLLLPFRSDKKL